MLLVLVCFLVVAPQPVHAGWFSDVVDTVKNLVNDLVGSVIPKFSNGDGKSYVQNNLKSYSVQSVSNYDSEYLVFFKDDILYVNSKTKDYLDTKLGEKMADVLNGVNINTDIPQGYFLDRITSSFDQLNKDPNYSFNNYVPYTTFCADYNNNHPIHACGGNNNMDLKLDLEISLKGDYISTKKGSTEILCRKGTNQCFKVGDFSYFVGSDMYTYTTEQVQDAIKQMYNSNSQKVLDEKYVDISQTFGKVRITKTYSFTSVHIKVEVLQDLSGLGVYEIISKDKLLSAKSMSSGSFDVVRDDPVIGWYFDNAKQGDTKELDYALDNTQNSQVVTLVTEDPVVNTNQGIIQVNFRDVCRDYEKEFTHFENLSGGKIESISGSKYSMKMCLSVLDTVTLGTTCDTQYKALFGIDTDKVTFTSQNPLCLNVDNNKYWFALRKQKEQPSGAYSCLFSYNDQGQVGMCNKLDSNLWIYLGEDNEPPVVSDDVQSTYDAHVTFVTLSAQDAVSGVDAIYYCLGQGCQPTTVYTKPISVTCDTNGACEKSISYYAVDYVGHKSDVVTKAFVLSQRNLACNSDCKLIGNNRYYEFCEGVNGCHFASAQVAKLCSGYAQGFRVEFNSTHDVVCPKAPIYAKENQNASLVSPSSCKNVFKKEIPVLVNGETTTMIVYTCADEK